MNDDYIYRQKRKQNSGCGMKLEIGRFFGGILMIWDLVTMVMNLSRISALLMIKLKHKMIFIRII